MWTNKISKITKTHTWLRMLSCVADEAAWRTSRSLSANRFASTWCTLSTVCMCMCKCVCIYTDTNAWELGSVYLSIYLSLCLDVCLSANRFASTRCTLSTVCMCMYSHVRVCGFNASELEKLFIHDLSFCLFIYLSVCLSVFVFCLYVCLSVCLSEYPQTRDSARTQTWKEK